MIHKLQKWLLKSISRQVSILLVLLLSTALLLPAFYFYNIQETEASKTTKQLATQFINSLHTSISKSVHFKDNYGAWQIIKNELNNNQQQIDSGGFFKISEIAILDNNNLVFAHSSPGTHPLQKNYTGITPTAADLAAESDNILFTSINSSVNKSIRLYSNLSYQGNHNGLILIQLDLTLLNNFHQKQIKKFTLFFIITVSVILIIGYLFGHWISAPLKIIEESLQDIGSGRLNISKLHYRHDEYKKLVTTIETTDKELHESHSKIDLLLDSTAEAIYGIDLKGNCTFVNTSCLSMLRYTDKLELIGKTIGPLIHRTTSRSATDDIIDTSSIENKRYSNDEVIWRKDNTSFPAEYWSHPIFKDNVCIGAVITFLDTTERNKTLKELKEREQDLSIMLHSIGDAVIATNTNGEITRMNPVAEELTGWSFNDACGEKVKKIFPIINSTTRASIENPIEKVMGTGETVYLSNHTTLISKTGKEYHIADSAAPIRNTNNDIQGMILVFNDVTEQYIMRAEISEQKVKLQKILDDLQSMVSILDLDGTLTFINSMPLKVSHLKEEDVLGLKLWDLNFFNYNDDIRQSVKNDCFKAAAGHSTFNDIALSTPDGLFWIEFSVHPVTNSAGDIIQLVAEGKDINKRKEQEEVLRRSQKMDAIGQLAGGIAHDFNNQLGVVIGYLDILQSSLTNEKQLKWIERSTHATLRCVDLTRQLLTFSRNKSTEKKPCDINAILTELHTMIVRTVTPEVEVEYFLSEDLWLTDINSGDFQDSILNLVINARDVMPKGGKLIVETSNKYLDEDYARNQLDIEPGEYIQVMISDTGYGMDKAILEKIFEPFFTTKDEGKGTGLGLAMVYSFVKRFGGGIRFYSEIDIGTTIRIYLPRTVTPEVAYLEAANSTDLPRGNETILIVDDEKDLLELASTYLTDLGYQVKTADNARMALNILENDNSINLLFSDVVMPGGINGYELAEQTNKNWPEIKILLTSGFTSRVNSSKKPLKFDQKLLSKPYRKSELAYNIRLTLDEID